MSKIHPTAIIDPTAELAEDVEVGPYVVIEGDVRIGPRTRLWPRAFVGRWTTVGADNQIHMGAVVGHEPQDVTYQGEASYLRVGDRNVFREYSYLHRGAKAGSETVVGNDNYLMATAHVAHNARVGNHVIMAPGSLVAGHVQVEDRVFLSGHIAIHQFCRIGTLAFVSGVSAVNQDVPPYMIAGGRPAEVSSLNATGLRRAGHDAAARRKLKEAFRHLFRSSMPLTEAILSLEEEGDLSVEVRHLVDFIRSSKRGICRVSEWSRNADRQVATAYEKLDAES